MRIGKFNQNFTLHIAFTLAEVLIVLGIIGIIAECTIPTVLQDFQKQQALSTLKKEYSTIQQGFKMYLADQGTTDISQTDLFAQDGNTNYESSATRQNVWGSMVKKYFNVIKACNVGDNACNVFDSWLTSSDEEYDSFWNDIGVNTEYLAYLADGSLLGLYPHTLSDCAPQNSKIGSMKGFCGEIYTDINGTKPPNKYGRDIFEFIVGPDGSLFPFYGMQHAQWYDGTSWASSANYWKNWSVYCGNPNSTALGSDVQGFGCTARIMEDGWQINY